MDQRSVLQLLSNYKRTRGPHLGIRSLGIFGSMARDQAAPASDVDIVVRNKFSITDLGSIIQPGRFL